MSSSSEAISKSRKHTQQKQYSDLLGFPTSLRYRSVPTFTIYLKVKLNDPPIPYSYRLRNSERFTKHNMIIFLRFLECRNPKHVNRAFLIGIFCWGQIVFPYLSARSLPDGYSWARTLRKVVLI